MHYTKIFKSTVFMLFICFMLFFVSFSQFSVAKAESTTAETGNDSITIFSWEDYIDEGYDMEEDIPEVLLEMGIPKEKLMKSVLDLFEEETGIKVNYYSFATNEEMYNELKKNPGAVDLICPSEYMVMKMKSEGLVQEYPMPENYKKYGSPYIKDVFRRINLAESDEEELFSIGYMWGTMGFIYNADKFSAEEFSNWDCLFEDKFYKKATIKDSLRDTYIMALAILNKDKLLDIKEDLANNTISENDYKKKLSSIFNDTSKETVDKVGDKLIELKKNLYGFEVDAGKGDIITGKIDVNFAWSGDAVYTIFEGENVNKNLKYVVPEEGSNVWFDGWVMTKDAHKENAMKFLNYMCEPETVMRNMEYVGYTSCVGGDKVFEYVKSNFNDDEGEREVNLGYFFEPGNTTDYIIKTSEKNGALYAQYSDEETILRCAVMNNFSDEDLELVNEMWNKVKLITLSDGWIITISVFILLGIVVAILIKYKSKIFKK